MVWWVEKYSNCSMGLDMVRGSLDEHGGPPQPISRPQLVVLINFAHRNTSNSLTALTPSLRRINPPHFGRVACRSVEPSCFVQRVRFV